MSLHKSGVKNAYVLVICEIVNQRNKQTIQRATYGGESCLQEVTHCRGGALRLGVHILDTGKLQYTLRGGCSDDTSTPWRWDKTTHDGTNFAADFRRHRMGFTKGSTPVTSSNRDDGELGENDGTTYSCCDLLRALDSQSNVTVKVSDGNERLETSTLAGTGLLLDGHDLHDFILELGQEEVDNLELLDGQRRRDRSPPLI